MKRYIKIDSNNNIIDIFGEHLKENFDGTEIFLDEINSPADVWINGKCITDEFNNPLFSYKDGKIIEIDLMIYKNQYEETIKKNMIKNLKLELNEIDFKSIRDIREWIAKQPGCSETLKSYESLIKIKRNNLNNVNI